LAKATSDSITGTSTRHAVGAQLVVRPSARNLLDADFRREYDLGH
jgi:hypothetical protein